MRSGEPRSGSDCRSCTVGVIPFCYLGQLAQVVLAFGCLDAVVSEAELYDSPTSMRFHNDCIENVIVWAVAKSLIEPINERGKYRLTDKGKKAFPSVFDDMITKTQKISLGNPSGL